MVLERTGEQQPTGASRARRAFGRALAIAVVGAVTIANAGVWASGNAGQDRPTPRPTRPGTPEPSSVSPEARKKYDEFWKRLPREKADALEQQLNTLEGRQRKGESVDRELDELRREHPALFQMSGTTLQSARWTITTNGATAAATCTGLGWIGRNGRLRCLGRLTAG